MSPCPTRGVPTNDEIIDPRTVTIEWIEKHPYHAQTMLRTMAAEVFEWEKIKEKYEQLLARVQTIQKPQSLAGADFK